MTDHLPTGQARELLEAHKGQRVRVEQHTLGGDLVIEVGYLHYEQETRTWGIRDAVVTYPAADVYVDPRHLINVTPEQRGVLWDYVHRAVCEAGVAEGAAEQLADRMLAALTVEDTATVEHISRTYHRQPLSRRPDQRPIRTREDLADVVAHVAPGVAREQAEQVAERLMPRLTRRDALIRAQRAHIEELLAQLDRYRLAWRSARRRATQYRDDRDHAQAHRLAQAVDHDTPLPYRTGDWVSRRGSQEIVRVTGVVYYGPRRGHIYTATGTRWGHGPAAPDEYELVYRDSTDTHGPTELQEGPDQ